MPLMNAPFLLNEIALALEALAKNGESRTLFLSQFPMTPEDAEFLQRTLGPGQTLIQSGGASPAVWRETGVSGVWWGEVFGADRKVVLRTIEIACIPELAVTPAEDIAAGLAEFRARLPEALAAAGGEQECTKLQ
jgi:hydrogenase-1 operon protein HyaF